MRCPHCKTGDLMIVRGYEPWTDDHIMCDRCHSTYCIGQMDHGARLAIWQHHEEHKEDETND